MTLENPEKPKPESAKGIELKEKIRLAVALKYLRNLSDAQIAEHFHLSPYTVADWKRRYRSLPTTLVGSNRISSSRRVHHAAI